MDSGSILNLDANNLRVNYGTGPSPAAQIRSAPVTGYHGGAWNGPGIN